MYLKNKEIQLRLWILRSLNFKGWVPTSQSESDTPRGKGSGESFRENESLAREFVWEICGCGEGVDSVEGRRKMC